MTPKAPTGGRGSNQYRQRGRSTVADRTVDRRLVDALEREALAAAFGGDPGDDMTPLGMTRVATAGTLAQRTDLVNRSDTPFEIRRWLADNDPDTQVWLPATRQVYPERPIPPGDYSRVTTDPDTPADVLARMSADQESLIRAGVAENPAVPIALLSRLVNDPEAWVRRQVARFDQRNDPAPEGADVVAALLTQLADDEIETVRSEVASQSRCPPEVLARLSDDESGAVRAEVARNRNTPPEVLARMVNEELVERVRQHAEVNPNRQMG